MVSSLSVNFFSLAYGEVLVGEVLDVNFYVLDGK
jgi:hypothetical protein